MARTTATNFSGGLQFPYATAATDVFHKEDIQTLAQAVDQHDHTAGKGVTVPISTNASLLTNGGFEQWQRGNGPFNTLNAYCADRWYLAPGAGSTISVSRDSANADVGSQYCAAVTYTHSALSQLVQNVLSVSEYVPSLRGRTVTLSVRVRGSVASSVRLRMNDGVTGVQNSSYHTGSGTYETLSLTYSVSSAPTQLALGIEFNASGTYYIDNAMLVVGSQAAAYVPLHPADDLARCERYYELIWLNGAVMGGSANGAGQRQFELLPFQFTKAVTPTATVSAPATWAGINTTSTSPTLWGPTTAACGLSISSTAAGECYMQGNTAGAAIILESNP